MGYNVRGRVRNYYDRFNTADPITRVIAFAALALIIVIGLPRLAPNAASGVGCLNLAPPQLTGNNQSVLASQLAAQPDTSVLTLELIPYSTTINVSGALELDVRFINVSMAPISLFLVPESTIFRYNNEEIGLLIFMQRIGQNRAIGEFADRSPALTVRQQYPRAEVHLLGPTQRCTYTIQIGADRLAAAGVTPGQYRIAVIYRNVTRGALPAVGQLTPTPIFPDQGVWTGQVQSNDVIINIGVPTPVPQ
jgi:hypothetical protein